MTTSNGTTPGAAAEFAPLRFQAEARELLESTTDTDFCLLLTETVRQPDWDGTVDLRQLYEPWILRRLKAIRARAAPVYYGLFLVRGRQHFGRHFVPQDLDAAMAALPLPPEEALLEGGDAGDVAPEAWTTMTQDLYEHGLPAGVSTGWPALDARYRVRPGELTVVTGVSSHLKSGWVQALCVNLALYHGWRFGIWAGEHAPSLLAASLDAMYAGLPFDGPQRMDDSQQRQATRWTTDHFHVIAPPDEAAPALPGLLATARVQAQRYGIQGLVLDPWNAMSHPRPRDQMETRYIGDMLGQVLRFAKHWHVHVWIVAHPTKQVKAQKGPYAGQYPPPTPYDISGSADWFNKADNCLTVWRNVEARPREIELHICKVRFRGANSLGCIPMRLDPQSGRLCVVEATDRWDDQDDHASPFKEPGSDV